MYDLLLSSNRLAQPSLKRKERAPVPQPPTRHISAIHHISRDVRHDPDLKSWCRRLPPMKFILILISVTLSSHTLGIQRPRTPCRQNQPQQPSHKEAPEQAAPHQLDSARACALRSNNRNGG